MFLLNSKCIITSYFRIVNNILGPVRYLITICKTDKEKNGLCDRFPGDKPAGKRVPFPSGILPVQLLNLLSELARRYSDQLSEHPEKIGIVIESALVSDRVQ